MTDPIRLIPLSDLTLSDLNTRQTVADDEIEAMAESIATTGLLQNLIGLDRDGRIEIVGGGKRLRALQKLADEGRRQIDKITGTDEPIWTSVDPVPVLVTFDEAEAIAWSGAENTARSALNPADEITAYSALSAKGSSAAMIARTYAVSPAHVQRMLKLADLPEPVIANLRAGKIDVEQARAFTIAPSPSACIDVLGQAIARRLNAHQIRHLLQPDTIASNDRRVRYVGIDAYRDAGGALTEDLFDDRTYIHDEKLLDRLFMEKAEAATEALRVEGGWAWAMFVADKNFWEWPGQADLIRINQTAGELTEADQDEYDRLTELSEQGVLDEPGVASLDALQARLDGDHTDDDRARGGIVTKVMVSGELVIDGAYQRKADVAGTAADGGAEGDDATGKATAQPDPEKGISQSLREDLHIIRRRAIQTALFAHHETLLDLLVFSLLPEVKSWERPLAITAEPQPTTPKQPEGLTEDARFDAQHPAWHDDTAAAFKAFVAQGKSARNRALDQALTRAFKLVEGPLVQLLLPELPVNPRAIWTPTKEDFFGRLPVPRLDAIWEELTPIPDADPVRGQWAGLKKAQKADQLHRLFNDLDYREAMGLSRTEAQAIDSWLPTEMTFTPDAADAQSEAA